jgi:hypothetical protein
VINPELKKLGVELTELEKRAGIDKQVESALLGPMFPNLEASPDEYFKDVEYHARRKVRKLYFAVEDIGLRKVLIAKRRECDTAAEAHWQEIITQERKTLAAATRKADSLPWLQAGSYGVLFVALGSYFFHIYGAIGGALLGFFLGQGMIAQARTFNATAMREAQEQLDQSLETERQRRATPDWFNAGEARTGEMDEDFDRLSVYDHDHPQK